MSEKGLFAITERIVKSVTNALMALNIFLILTSVFFRYVMDDPIVWSEELAKYLLVWTVFLAASNLIRHWSNLRVTMVMDRLSPKALFIFDAIIKFIAFIFISFLFLLALKSIPNVWHREMSPSLGIPMVLPELAIIVGLGLMVLQFIGLFVDIFHTISASKRSNV
jgi:TRAP-type C4-dicarboxylate transport system permease small subunit